MHLEGDVNCISCQEVGKLIEINDFSSVLPCIILSKLNQINNEIKELFEKCKIKILEEDAVNGLDLFVENLHDLEFDVLYEDQMTRDYFGHIVRKTFQFDENRFVLGKLWIPQKIANETVINCRFEEFLENSELPNVTRQSPFRLRLLIMSCKQLSRVETLVKRIYLKPNSFQCLFIPTLLENEASIDETESTIKNKCRISDKNFNNIVKSLCIYVDKIEYHLGLLVIYMIIYRFQLFGSFLCNLFKFINQKHLIKKNEYHAIARTVLNSSYDIWRMTFSIVLKVPSMDSLINQTMFLWEHLKKPHFSTKYFAFFSIQLGILVTSHKFYMKLYRKLALVLGTLIYSIEIKNQVTSQFSGVHDLNAKLWTENVLQNRKMIYFILSSLHILNKHYVKYGENSELEWLQIIRIPGFLELVDMLRAVNRKLCNHASNSDSITIYHPKCIISMDLIRFGGFVPTWLNNHSNWSDNSYTVKLNLPPLEMDPTLAVLNDPSLLLFYGSLCAEFQILIESVCKRNKIMVRIYVSLNVMIRERIQIASRDPRSPLFIYVYAKMCFC